jgi:hypothetical protein
MSRRGTSPNNLIVQLCYISSRILAAGAKRLLRLKLDNAFTSSKIRQWRLSPRGLTAGVTLPHQISRSELSPRSLAAGDTFPH